MGIVFVRSRLPHDRTAFIERLRAAMTSMLARWEAVAMGESLLVAWPDRVARSHGAHLPREQHSHYFNRPASALHHS